MIIEVPLDGRFPVNEEGGRVVAVPVLSKGKNHEVDVVIYNVHEVGDYSSKLEVVAVLREVTIRLVGGGVLAYRNTVVC